MLLFYAACSVVVHRPFVYYIVPRSLGLRSATLSQLEHFAVFTVTMVSLEMPESGVSLICEQIDYVAC